MTERRGRPKRKGARICARCKKVETPSIWQPYCRDCARIQQRERPERQRQAREDERQAREDERKMSAWRARRGQDWQAGLLDVGLIGIPRGLEYHGTGLAIYQEVRYD